MSTLTADSISLTTFNKILARYPSLVPEKLQELDTLRYETIPAAVAKRIVDGKGDAYLTKDEVESLVEWKLKHGTLRPSLLQLVSSNSPELIKSRTREAFSLLRKTYKWPKSPVNRLTASPWWFNPIPALDCLTKPYPTPKGGKLKGIGPATGALLLSVCSDQVPFFSDEVYRWMMFGGEGGKGKGGDPWTREIKYNAKEYEMLWPKVVQLMRRLGFHVSGYDVEKVAWVLGREKADLAMGLDGEEEEGVEDDGKNAGVKEKKKNVRKVVAKDGHAKGKKAAKKAAPVPKKGVKRKVEDEKPPVEGLRRSTRRKA